MAGWVLKTASVVMLTAGGLIKYFAGSAPSDACCCVYSSGGRSCCVQPDTLTGTITNVATCAGAAGSFTFTKTSPSIWTATVMGAGTCANFTLTCVSGGSCGTSWSLSTSCSSAPGPLSPVSDTCSCDPLMVTFTITISAGDLVCAIVGGCCTAGVGGTFTITITE